MATYYVGSGGNDANSGLTWELRKLTLNGAEDVPVTAGDTVYIGPGVYREMLTCDVSGSSGNPITYIGDVTGENTDGVGGVVRITGSDDDQSATRENCVAISSRDYRTFRGFDFDTVTSALFSVIVGNHIIVEDCYFMHSGTQNINFSGICTNNIVRRCLCLFPGGSQVNIQFAHTTTVDDTNNLVENCIIVGSGHNTSCIQITRIGGITIKHILTTGSLRGVNVATDPATGQTNQVYNSLFTSNYIALNSATLGFLIEDYNTLFGNNTDRVNVAVGANSVTYPPLFTPPILKDDIRFPWRFGELSEWSQVKHLTGTSMPTDDFFGITRPTDAKKSWGAIQYIDGERSTTQSVSGASLKLADASNHQMFVPVNGSQITISAKVYREANYAGTLPQMVIKQPGQSDRTTTDTGIAEQFNTLTDTFTPAASPPYVVVELVSNNTATSGSYAIYFDDVEVT